MKTIADWHSLLVSQGARMDETGAISAFGEDTSELRASRDIAAITPLTDTGIISISGEDAQAFLNTQLTSDVRRVTAESAQYSGYCTPKGRLLATFIVVLHDGEYLLILPSAIAESLSTRLQRYVMRSRVKVQLSSDQFALIGVTGSRSASTVTECLGIPLLRPLELAQKNSLSVIALPRDRQLVVCGLEHIEQTWDLLRSIATPAGANAWILQGIRSGIGSVTVATQEAFVPQMLGLDLLGGVSFDKGCYPGQEIVARTQYLGNLKRRLYFGRSTQLLVAGDGIVDAASGKTVGTVTDAALATDGRWEFLAVAQREALESADKLTSTRGQPVVVERPVADMIA